MKISDMENATKAIRILRSVQYELKKIQSLEIEENPINDIFSMGNKITSDLGFDVVPN
jgi:nicotinic acid phosphoribosyltransferase